MIRAEWWLWRRLAWRQAAALLLAIALAAGTVAWRTVATIRSLDDVALQSQARLVADQLSASPDGRRRRRPGCSGCRRRSAIPPGCWAR